MSINEAISQAINQFGREIITERRFAYIVHDFGGFRELPSTRMIILEMISYGFMQKLSESIKNKIDPELIINDITHQTLLVFPFQENLVRSVVQYILDAEYENIKQEIELNKNNISRKYDGIELRLLGFYNHKNQNMYPESILVEEAKYLSELFEKTYENISDIKDENNQILEMYKSAVFIYRDRDSNLYAYFPKLKIARISNVIYDRSNIIKAENKYKAWFVIGEKFYEDKVNSKPELSWDKFERLYTLGSIHYGTVIKISNPGGIIKLEGGGTAFCPTRHLITPNGTIATVGDSMQFCIYAFEKGKYIKAHCHIEKSSSEIRDDSYEDIAKTKRSNSKENALTILRQIVIFRNGIEKEMIPVSNTVANIQNNIVYCNLDGSIVSGEIKNIFGWNRLAIGSKLFVCASKAERIIYGVAQMTHQQLLDLFEEELVNIPSEKDYLFYDRMISLTKYLNTTFKTTYNLNAVGYSSTLRVFKNQIKTYMRFNWNVPDREFTNNADYDYSETNIDKSTSASEQASKKQIEITKQVDEFRPGNCFRCTIIRKDKEGYYLITKNHTQAYLPRSEASWNKKLNEADFQNGKQIKVVVIPNLQDGKPFTVSVKRLLPDPMAPYSRNTRHQGKITGETNNVFYITFNDGVSGIILKSSIKANTFNIGDVVNVNVKQVDRESRVLILEIAIESEFTGKDIMKLLNLCPCKEVGIIKQRLKSAIENGEIDTSYEAGKAYVLSIVKDIMA